MTKLSPRDIRVLEDDLSAVVRDARAATKDLRAALADGKAMMAEVIRENFTANVQRNVDEALNIMYDKLTEATNSAIKKHDEVISKAVVQMMNQQMAVAKEMHAAVFSDWNEEEILEVLAMARMMVSVRDRLREGMTISGADGDPLEVLARMGDEGVSIAKAMLNANKPNLDAWRLDQLNTRITLI